MHQRRRVTVVGASVVAPTAPTLTAPAAASAVVTSQAVTVSATVTAGQVPDRIDWVLNPGVSETVIATDSTSPYSQTWTVAQAYGDYTLVARFVYGSGHVDSATRAVAIGPAGTIVWLRADLGTTIGTGVSTWADLGGSSHNVTQATGANQPTIDATGAPNSLPALLFDGSNDNLAGSWTWAQPAHVWIVVKYIAPASDGTSIDGSLVNHGRMRYQPDGPYFTAGSQVGPLTGTTQTNWTAYEIQWNGASFKARVKGGTYLTGNCNTNALGGLTLGAAGGAATPGHCEIAEVIGFSTIQAAQMITDIETYIGARYSL